MKSRIARTQSPLVGVVRPTEITVAASYQGLLVLAATAPNKRLAGVAKQQKITSNGWWEKHPKKNATENSDEV